MHINRWINFLSVCYNLCDYRNNNQRVLQFILPVDAFVPIGHPRFLCSLLVHRSAYGFVCLFNTT